MKLKAFPPGWMRKARRRLCKAGAGWDESKHPRGQPGNAGQFGPGGGGGGNDSGSGPPTKERAGSKPLSQVRALTAKAREKLKQSHPLDKNPPPPEPKSPEQAAAYLEAINKHPYIRAAHRLVELAEPTDKTYKKNGKWSEERQKLHAKFKAEVLTEDTKAPAGTRPKVVLLLGAPGAGKSTAGVPIAEKLGGKFANVNADAAKEALPEYEGWNAGSLHEESSDMVEGPKDNPEYGVIHSGRKDRHNMILDMTGANGKKMVALAEAFAKDDYEVHVIHVKFPAYKSMARAANRFLKNPLGAVNPDPKKAGRYVPPGYAYQNVDGKPDETYKQLKEHAGVTSWHQVDTDVPKGTPPKLVESGKRKRENPDKPSGAGGHGDYGRTSPQSQNPHVRGGREQPYNPYSRGGHGASIRGLSRRFLLKPRQ